MEKIHPALIGTFVYDQMNLIIEAKLLTVPIFISGSTTRFAENELVFHVPRSEQRCIRTFRHHMRFEIFQKFLTIFVEIDLP